MQDNSYSTQCMHSITGVYTRYVCSFFKEDTNCCRLNSNLLRYPQVLQEKTTIFDEFTYIFDGGYGHTDDDVYVIYPSHRQLISKGFYVNNNIRNRLFNDYTFGD